MISQPDSSMFPCSPLPSGTCRTPGLSIPWCLPTSSFVCLVFFPLSPCLARWFWPDLMNGRHDQNRHCVQASPSICPGHSKQRTVTSCQVWKSQWQLLKADVTHEEKISPISRWRVLLFIPLTVQLREWERPNARTHACIHTYTTTRIPAHARTHTHTNPRGGGTEWNTQF